jgi:hypothetical protein
MNNQQRRNTLIEFIRKHPGCTKEKIVKQEAIQISRVTVFKLLEELKNEGIVDEVMEKGNSRDHKLFVNTSNLLVIVPKELEEFEKAFFPLFEKAKREFQYRAKKSKFNSSEFSSIYQLISQPLFMFYQVVNSYYIRSLMLWPTIILEEDALKNLYTIVFTKIANMQSRISEILRSLNTPNMNVGLEAAMLRRMLYATEKMMISYDIFTKFGMQKEMESLLDSLWKINLDYQEHAFPEPKIYGWNFKYRDDSYSWRKLMELQKQYPDQTYERHLNNYCNNMSGSYKND